MRKLIMVVIVPVVFAMGVTSCEFFDNDTGNISEYVRYTINGTVTNEEGLPISGIGVTAVFTGGFGVTATQTATTGDDGQYTINQSYLEFMGYDAVVTAGGTGTVIEPENEDDGEPASGNENFDFEVVEQRVPFVRDDFVNGDGFWYIGRATKRLDFVLTPAPEEEPEEPEEP